MERALSIVPGLRSMGVAVLEGSERLVEWRLARFRETAVTAKATVFRQLVIRFAPTLIVVEDFAGSRRGKHARRVVDRVRSIAAEANLAVETISRRDVAEHFREGASDGYELAIVLANFFPELAARVPPRRFVGDGEDPRISMFTAIANALVVLRARESQNHHQGDKR